MFPDRADRIQALIAFAEEYRHPGPSEVVRDSSCRVPGCESDVYVAPGPRIAVDNPQGVSSQALAVILEDGLKGASQEELRNVDEEIVYRIFGRELSMGKSMGLTNTVRMARDAVR